MPRRTLATRGTRRDQRRAPRRAKTKIEVYIKPTSSLPWTTFIIHRKCFYLDHKWRRSGLLAVKPNKIIKFLIKIYGNANTDPGVVPPIYYQSNMIKTLKKAWSHFMVNTMVIWDKLSRNPARYAEIYDLIGLMIKMEVAQRGMSSHARHALTTDEYQHIIGQLGNNDIMAGAGNRPGTITKEYILGLSPAP